VISFSSREQFFYHLPNLATTAYVPKVRYKEVCRVSQRLAELGKLLRALDCFYPKGV
jgi:hypothetical protein